MLGPSLTTAVCIYPDLYFKKKTDPKNYIDRFILCNSSSQQHIFKTSRQITTLANTEKRLHSNYPKHKILVGKSPALL